MTERRLDYKCLGDTLHSHTVFWSIKLLFVTFASSKVPDFEKVKCIVLRVEIVIFIFVMYVRARNFCNVSMSSNKDVG